MPELETKTELDIEGFSNFSISSNPYSCRFMVASGDHQVATEFVLQNPTIWGLIDEIEQTLVGPRQRIHIHGVSMLQLSEDSNVWRLAITFQEPTITLTFQSKRELRKFSDALKSTSQWNPEKSDLISPEVSKYLQSRAEDIAKDITDYIKVDLNNDEKLALYDIDTIDSYFKSFWKDKGTEWIKVNILAQDIGKKIEETERIVLDNISEATIRAQDGLVDALSKDIVSFCRENKLDRVSKKTVDEFCGRNRYPFPNELSSGFIQEQIADYMPDGDNHFDFL